MTAPSDFNSIPELDATLVFRVAYDGSSYSGFAEQPGQTTVAGELRRAIETLLRRPIDLTCAGRTDAGVHAVAQYISVPVTDAELALTRRRWLRAMDALLPKDIAINEVYRARKGFSARFDAVPVRIRTVLPIAMRAPCCPVVPCGGIAIPWTSRPCLRPVPRFG
ncbi:MAG: hypothetical protein ACLU0O_00160 [Collinsella sp.]